MASGLLREEAEIDFEDSTKTAGVTFTYYASGYRESGEVSTDKVTEKGSYQHDPQLGLVSSATWEISNTHADVWKREVTSYREADTDSGPEDQAHYAEHEQAASLAETTTQTGGYGDKQRDTKTTTSFLQTDHQHDVQETWWYGAGEEQNAGVIIRYEWSSEGKGGEQPTENLFGQQTLWSTISLPNGPETYDLNQTRNAPNISTAAKASPGTNKSVNETIKIRKQQELDWFSQIKKAVKRVDQTLPGNPYQKLYDWLKSKGVTDGDLLRDLKDLRYPPELTPGPGSRPFQRTIGKIAGTAKPATPGAMLDALQLSLDVLGLVPGVGEPLDLLNAAIYAARGRYTDAALSAASATPFLGNFIFVGKLGKKAVGEVVEETLEQGGKKFDDLVEFVDPKHVDDVAPKTFARRVGDAEALISRHAIDMSGAPASSARNALGFQRNGPWFWRQLRNQKSELFSPENLRRIKQGRSPVVDETWIRHNPQHADYLGDKLIHHHIDQGRFASGLPETAHQELFDLLHRRTLD